MDNTIDLNFNFKLLDENVNSWLGAYNVAKDEFYAGREDEKDVYDSAEKTIKQINVALEFINYRLFLIDNEYMEDKNHNKTKLKKERFDLLKKINWYGILERSISEECEKIKNGDFGQDEELDF